MGGGSRGGAAGRRVRRGRRHERVGLGRRRARVGGRRGRRRGDGRLRRGSAGAGRGDRRDPVGRGGAGRRGRGSAGRQRRRQRRLRGASWSYLARIESSRDRDARGSTPSGRVLRARRGAATVRRFSGRGWSRWRADGELVATLRTTADGSVRFWPGSLRTGGGRRVRAVGRQGRPPTAAPDQEVTLTADLADGRQRAGGRRRAVPPRRHGVDGRRDRPAQGDDRLRRRAGGRRSRPARARGSG